MKLEITCTDLEKKGFRKIGEYISKSEIEEVYECSKCKNRIYIRLKKVIQNE